MAIISSRQVQLALKNTIERIYIRITDENGDPIDADSLTLKIFDANEDVIVWDDFTEGYGETPALPTRIVKPASTTGQYYFPFGDTSFDDANTTENVGDYLFHWSGEAGSEPFSSVQLVKVLSVRTMRWLPKLRLIIDKAAKIVDEDPDDPVYIGYTEDMLVQFLEGGLGWINAFQPPVGWDTIDLFPDVHGRVLIDAAVCDALTSQEIFAVDTDINYCFAEGTPVIMSDGTSKPIELVQVGDKVLDRTGLPQTVEAAWCEGMPEELIELTLWGGKKFVVTKNHEWPVWAWLRTCHCGCGKKVRPGAVFSPGHHMRVKNCELEYVRGSKKCSDKTQSIPKGYDPIKRLASEELQKGDFLLMPRKFEEIETDVSLDEARMLGYYAAEGHLGFKVTEPFEARNIFFTFGSHEKDTWIADILAFGEKHGMDIRVDDDKNSKGTYVRCNNRYRKCEETLRLCRLAQTHVGYGSLTKKLSREAMGWSLDLKREFIKGAFRGDGHQAWSVNKEGPKAGRTFSVWYSSSSPALISQVQLILTQLGFPSTIITDKAKRPSKIRGVETTSSPCYRLRVAPQFSAELADMIWRDKSMANNFPKREGWSEIRPECMVDDDFIYVPIKSVKKVPGEKKVYNLTISGDHSYLVQNIATFNSDQGNVFVIDHQPKLSAILNATWQRLAQTVPPMKRQYLNSGSIHMQAGPNFRFATLLSTAPNGSLFRNAFMGGQ